MSCTICGKTTHPGALLCRPCKAALKRARQFTVLELPGARPAVTLPAVRSRPEPRLQRAPRPRRSLRATRLAVVGTAAAIVLAVAVYLGQSSEGARAALGFQPLGPVTRVAPAAADASNPERVPDLAPSLPQDRRR